MAATTLYAWATPAFVSGSPVDHTWVTTYDNTVHHYANAAAVAAAGRHYWFCWGSYHASGGALGRKAGSLSLARCLVQSNANSSAVPAARGTIYVYGVDGVCHQLANQVLYATSVTRLTVAKARGYVASTFLYGTYGLTSSAWASKIASCSATVTPVSSGAGGTASGGAAPTGGPQGGTPGGASTRGILKMADLPDDFAERAREVLGADSPELLKLLSLRAEVHGYLAQKIPGVNAPAAETLNARNQHLIDEAARLLGPQRFEQLFGFSTGEKINLVDPSIAEGHQDE